MSGILIAGLGNIFKGDDAFGVEVAQRLARRPMPPNVRVVDFGIRGIDLTYALLEDYSAAVLVDTVQRGGLPGTLYVIEPEKLAGTPAPEDLLMSPHELDPAKVLRVATTLGSPCKRIILIACEPLTFGNDQDGFMGLSVPVASAVDRALTVVDELLHELIGASTVEPSPLNLPAH